MRKSSVVGASLLYCLALVRPCQSDEKRPVREYTNTDLDRVHPYSDQTGVTSTPAVTTTGETTGGKARQGRRAGATAATERRSAEEAWRLSAEKFRAKLQPLRDKADDLRQKIEERRRKPGVRPYSDPGIVADERRLRILEQRIRDSESAFEDRARRQGALPGWIR